LFGLLIFLPLYAHESRRLLAFSFIPLAGYRSGLRSSFPARPIRNSPPFGFGVPQYPRRLHDLLRPLLTSTARSEWIASPSVTLCDMPQISRGKFDRLQRATAGFTTSELDGYGLRNHWPARPPP